MTDVKMKVKITPIISPVSPTEQEINPCIQTILSGQDNCEKYFNHELSESGESDFSKDIGVAMSSFECALEGLRVAISVHIDRVLDAAFKWDMKDPDSLQRLAERLLDYLEDL